MTPIPLVNADGSLADNALEGDPADPSIRQGEGKYLYGQLTTEMLSGSAALPARVLLRYWVGDRGQKGREAKAEAFLYGLLALLPAFLLTDLLHWLTRSMGFAVFGALALVVGAALHGYDKANRQTGHLREVTEWLDLEEQTWRQKKYFSEDSLPMVDATLMLRSLALVCTIRVGEYHNSYDVCLCSLQELQGSGAKRPSGLDDVFSCESREEANEFARALASRLRIGCREYPDDLAAGTH